MWRKGSSPIGRGVSARRAVVTHLQDQVPVERLQWFTDLRWWAAGVGLFILWVAPRIVSIRYDADRLVAVLALLAVLNAVYRNVWLRVRLRESEPMALARAARFHIHVQMSGDLGVLTLLLIWSGGTTNPLFLIYLFHLAIGSMALTRRESLVYAVLATLLPWGLWGLENIGWIQPLWASGEPTFAGPRWALLTVYSGAGWGLWLFLTRLTGDLLDKETALREAGDRLRAANDDLVRMGEQKNQFFRQIAHDLKNPLAASASCLEAAEVTLPRGRSVRSRGMIARAKVRLTGLTELVDDLIWLSQSKSSDTPYRKEKLNPYSMAQRAVQDVEEKALKKGLRVTVSGSAKTWISADPRAFLRVLSNLLDNAVKYTPSKGGEIRLDIEDADEWVVVAVSDSGIGIPEDEQGGLYQEFMRASNARSRGEPGTGLGLAIVKRILDWHEGKVKMVSRKDGGTRVETWWLPAPNHETRRGKP